MHLTLNEHDDDDDDDDDDVGKKFLVRGRPHDSKTHALCMLDTYGYNHTLRLCNTHCFSTAAVVAPTRFSVTLCVHCLSC